MYYAINKTTLEYFSGINPNDYNLNDWVVTDDVSEIQTIPHEYWKVSDDIIVEMNQAEKDIVDADNLSNLKLARYNEIDIKTGELISLGFEFPSASGNIFSFSTNAQSNLLGTFTAKDLLPYPFPWNTKDDELTYQIVDSTEMANFFMTALGTKKARQDSGSALKSQIRDAVNKAAVDAVIDNR